MEDKGLYVDENPTNCKADVDKSLYLKSIQFEFEYAALIFSNKINSENRDGIATLYYHLKRIYSELYRINNPGSIYKLNDTQICYNIKSLITEEFNTTITYELNLLFDLLYLKTGDRSINRFYYNEMIQTNSGITGLFKVKEYYIFKNFIDYFIKNRVLFKGKDIFDMEPISVFIDNNISLFELFIRDGGGDKLIPCILFRQNGNIYKPYLDYNPYYCQTPEYFIADLKMLRTNISKKLLS